MIAAGNTKYLLIMINELHWTFAIIVTSAGLVMFISMLVAAIWCIKHGRRFGSNCMSIVPPERPPLKCPPAIRAEVLEMHKRELKAHQECLEAAKMAGDVDGMLFHKHAMHSIRLMIIDLENANDKDHSADC